MADPSLSVMHHHVVTYRPSLNPIRHQAPSLRNPCDFQPSHFQGPKTRTGWQVSTSSTYSGLRLAIKDLPNWAGIEKRGAGRSSIRELKGEEAGFAWPRKAGSALGLGQRKKAARYDGTNSAAPLTLPLPAPRYASSPKTFGTGLAVAQRVPRIEVCGSIGR
jgi:hypothetical protein